MLQRELILRLIITNSNPFQSTQADTLELFHFVQNYRVPHNYLSPPLNFWTIQSFQTSFGTRGWVEDLKCVCIV